MTRHEALNALLAKVEAGEWDSLSALEIWPQGRVVDGEWVHEYSSALRSFEGSLDAAKALHESVLPEWLWSAGQGATACSWSVFSHREGVRRDCTSDTPARAWLIAILKALIAMEEDHA